MNTAILEFSQFAFDHGLILTADRIVADGKLHRVKVEGDSGSKKSGSYSLHEHANEKCQICCKKKGWPRRGQR
jgi:hypothetical protein